jgi:hypothetical protein
MRSAEEGAGRAIGIFFPARIAWTNRNKENIHSLLSESKRNLILT